MKKIGIVTISDDINLGNRLQNYATQEILSNYGHVDTIKRYYDCERRTKIRHYLSSIKKHVFFFVKKLFKSKKVENDRNINFYKFNHNVDFKYFFYKNINFQNLDTKFDVFAVGSDQIWNPNFYNDDMYINMLGFTSNEKKLAVAPSIAVDTLTDNQIKVFQKYLKDFDYLSCREEQGANLVTEIINKKCVSLIDPTLMLSKEDWLKVSKKPKFHDANKKYILLYFLGELTNKYKEIINNISKQYNLEIINIYDKNSKYYTCGPSEFIYLISNCEIMLTDSFHGSVFSYIFDKPLRIFKREDNIKSMNSRLINLMNKLNLNDEIYFNENMDMNSIFTVNYDKSYLKREQEKYKTYLDNYFNNLK